jgi:hypothetical protein
MMAIDGLVDLPFLLLTFPEKIEEISPPLSLGFSLLGYLDT